MQDLIERARPIWIHDLQPGGDILLPSNRLEQLGTSSCNYLIERVRGRVLRLPAAGSISVVDCSDLVILPFAIFTQVSLLRCREVKVAPPRGTAFACLAEFSAGLSLPPPALLRLLCCMDVVCADQPVRCNPWEDFLFEGSTSPVAVQPARASLSCDPFG